MLLLVLVWVTDGAPMLIVGLVLSTMHVALLLDPGDRFPDRSLALPAAMEIARVPVPATELMVTVRVVPVPVDTATLPVAVPVLISVTFDAVNSVLSEKLLSAKVTV